VIGNALKILHSW